MGASLLAMQAARSGRQTALLPSQASLLPQVLWHLQTSNLAGNIVEAGMLAMQAVRSGRQIALLPSQALYRTQSLMPAINLQ